MSQINITWNGISQEKWDVLLRQAERCAFQQAWAYGALFAQNNLDVNRFVARDVSCDVARDVARDVSCDVASDVSRDNGAPIAIGQIITRRYFGFVKFSLLLKGPIWLGNVTTDQKEIILQNIRARYPLKRFNLFTFSPDEKTGQAKYEDMGFREIITGNSTVLIDLKLPEDALWQNLYGKNRTDIRKAEKNNFEVIFSDHNHIYTDWLLKKEKKQQKEKKYQGLPVGLSKNYGLLYAPGQGVFTAFAVNKEKNTPICGILVLRHGDCATYHIGWNGREGRKCRALNLLLWQMILKLKQAGVATLDLGGINTAEGADIARYKLQFGGRVIKLGGTFM